MEDEKKTKKQLIEDLNELRQSVAELKSFKDEIKQSRLNQEKFTKAFRQNSIPMTISTVKDGRFIDVSDAFLRLVERKRDEVIGSTSRETGFITDEQRAHFHNELSKSVSIDDFEMEVTPKGRGLRYGLFNAVMMSYNNENYLLTTIQDITDRKQAEFQREAALESLRESEAKFRLLFNSGRDYMAVHLIGKDGQPGNFIQVNDAACEILGYTREEMLELSPQDVDSSKSSGRMPALIEKLIENKYILFETEMISKSGHWIPMDVSLTIFQLNNNQAVMCVARDNAQRQLRNKELLYSEKKYRQIVENISDCIFLVDKDNIIRHVTRSQEVLGYTNEELIGTSGFRITHPDDLARLTNLYQEGVTLAWLENNYEVRLRHKDGRYVLIDMRVKSITDEKGEFMAGVFVGRDITQSRKNDHEKLLATKSYIGDERLSLRENEVLEWIIEGKSTWDIANIMNISERTIKFHIDKIMKKLGAVNRAHAVAIAMKK